MSNQYVGIKIENDGLVETFEISALEDVLAEHSELEHLGETEETRRDDDKEVSSNLQVTNRINIYA